MASLCRVCMAIDLAVAAGDASCMHHDSGQALYNSAIAGCPLCAAFCEKFDEIWELEGGCEKLRTVRERCRLKLDTPRLSSSTLSLQIAGGIERVSLGVRGQLGNDLRCLPSRIC